jgi:hypothetical protein
LGHFNGPIGSSRKPLRIPELNYRYTIIINISIIQNKGGQPMESTIANIVNCCFGWILVALAVTGYYMTLKNRGEKWFFWNILAVGWGFFALAQTLLLLGVLAGTAYVIAIWLSSYVLVIASMILLFLKLAKLKMKSS